MRWSDNEHQAIREIAHSIWEMDRRPHGDHLAHWLLAESVFESARSLIPEIRDAMIATKRAFVFVKNIEHRFIGEKTTHTITGWNFITQWENGGDTPAKNRTTHVHCGVFEGRSNLIPSSRTRVMSSPMGASLAPRPSSTLTQKFPSQYSTKYEVRGRTFICGGGLIMMTPSTNEPA
jgi:Protein of unknown function (DUF2934)